MVNNLGKQMSQAILSIATLKILIEKNKVEVNSDLSSDVVVSAQLRNIYTLDQFLSLSHPLDRQCLIDSIKNCYQNKQKIDLIFLSNNQNDEGGFLKLQAIYQKNISDDEPCIVCQLYAVPISMISAKFLQEKYLFLRTLLENMSEGVVACNANGVLTLFNRITRDFHGLGSAIIPAEQWSNYYSLYCADGSKKLKYNEVPLIRALNGEDIHHVEMVIAPNGCQRRIVSCAGKQIINANKEVLGAVVTMHDITKQKNNEQELARLNRVLWLKNCCNQLVIHSVDENELLCEMSQLMVSRAGFPMSWVGFIKPDGHLNCQLIAQAGTHAKKYFDIFLSKAVSQEKSFFELLRKGHFFAGHRAKNGFKSIYFDHFYDKSLHNLVFFPLGDAGHPCGFFAIYMQSNYFFDKDEIELFSTIIDNLNYAIRHLRGQKDRHMLEEVLLKVAAGMSAATEEGFFKQLLRTLQQSFFAKAAVFIQCYEQLPPKTIAAVVDADYHKDITFTFNDFSYSHLIKKEKFMIRDYLSVGFFQDEALNYFKIKTCMGIRVAHNDQQLGYLMLAFDNYIERPDFVFSALKIFATRTATEIKRQEAEKKIKFQASLLDCANDAIIVRDMSHNIIFWNKGAERLFGWSSAEVLGKEALALLSDSKQQSERAVEKLLAEGAWSGEMLEKHRCGHKIMTECHWTLIYDDQGMPQCILAIKNDISHRKAAEQEIQQLAFYDHLTLLPNRLLLMNRLKKSLYDHQRSSMYGAVLFIDLDNFKMLNDTLGHDKGDMLLQQVAQRLTDTLRKGDTVARLGGDEFVVLVEDLKKDYRAAAYQARRIGEKILKAFAQPFYLDDSKTHAEKSQAHFSSPSIGISLFGQQNLLIDDVLKHADLAMYQAKAAGRNTMQFFDPSMQKQVTDRAILEAQLREAVSQKSFVLYYQPQMDRQQRMIGVEALLRWQHHDKGVVSPADFIPVAEESGLILPLGQWVLETACEQLSQWKKHNVTRHLSMSVNVSARQFYHPGFVNMVLGILDKTAVDPTRLKLELTESILVTDMQLMIDRMNTLKDHGVCFSLDDFGTGYSSLLYLKRMPLDELKIDKSFVREVLNNENDAAIAKTILALGHSLGLSVIAEGVEQEAQQQFLMAHQCENFQGYLYGKPMPIDRLECLLGLSVLE